MANTFLYIGCFLYISFISILNILFIYLTAKNYENIYTDGFFKINIVCEVIIDFILFVSTYLMIYVEFNYYIKNKNKDIFKYLGEIKSKRTRLLFGIFQIFISCYYIKNNSNTLNNIIITKTIFSLIYVFIGIINIGLSFCDNFTIKNKNRESILKT